MGYTIFISSFLLGFGLLIILSLKCKIALRIGMFLGLIIGFLTAIISYIFYDIVTFMPLQIALIFECFVITILTGLFIMIRFYRDPARTVPSSPNFIVSPADGTIRYIKEINKGTIPFSEKRNKRFKLEELVKTDALENSAYLIGIEMSILDVHVNRSPVSGRLTLQKPSKGVFISLRNIESIFTNERVTTIIDTGSFQIAVVQIASRLVRRIVSYLKEGDSIQIGQRMGMIKFGSQVDMVIPDLPEMVICRRVGDHVTAGTTVLCKYKIDDNK